MRASLFKLILNDLTSNTAYFIQKVDGFGHPSFSPLDRVLSSVYLLATGFSTNDMENYYDISKTTIHDSFYHFYNHVIMLYSDKYLRELNSEDVQRIMDKNTLRGYLGMLGSIDSMHWIWKNCLVSRIYDYQGYKKNPTIVREAVADQDLWFWYTFFGVPGSCNDINVLQRSPFFDRLRSNTAPLCAFTVNNNQYTLVYYIADGIYPKYATFVKTIRDPNNEKHDNFARRQEVVGKDVERAFGVLQARWHILMKAAQTHNEETWLA